MKSLLDDFRRVIWKQKEIENDEITKQQEVWYWENYVKTHWQEPKEQSESLDATFA